LSSATAKRGKQNNPVGGFLSFAHPTNKEYMNTVTCINVSVFDGALTRGSSYTILKKDSAKGLIKIRTDNNRIRWFPIYCFAEGAPVLLKVTQITVDEQILNAFCDAIEVTLSVIEGEKVSKRWCYFITPAYVYKMFHNTLPSMQTLGRHSIFVPLITTETIKKCIDYLEVNNLIEEVSLPLE
jgi:hypothetical protein